MKYLTPRAGWLKHPAAYLLVPTGALLLIERVSSSAVLLRNQSTGTACLTTGSTITRNVERGRLATCFPLIGPRILQHLQCLQKYAVSASIVSIVSS